ncbi:hypothetical protein NJ7G_1884 [Natrinema sp. J7-2]|nr:hypothetical protein NJ7G_1884 [Natrinema sp. J7-2]
MGKGSGQDTTNHRIRGAESLQTTIETPSSRQSGAIWHFARTGPS